MNITDITTKQENAEDSFALSSALSSPCCMKRMYQIIYPPSALDTILDLKDIYPHFGIEKKGN